MASGLKSIHLFDNSEAPRGIAYDPHDFHDAQQNFHAFSKGDNPIFPVSFALGHEEDFERGKTDLPSHGRVTAIRHDGRNLFADVPEITPEADEAIKTGKFHSISPELYPEPPDGIPREAIVAELRRRGFDVDRLMAEATATAREDAAAKEAKGEKVHPKTLEWMITRLLAKPLGTMLRRVNALGHEPPAQKGKVPLQLTERFSERCGGPLKYVRTEECTDANGVAFYRAFSELGDYVTRKMPIIKEDHPEKTQEQALGMAYGMGREKGLKNSEGKPMATWKSKFAEMETAGTKPAAQDYMQHLGEMGMDTAAMDGVPEPAKTNALAEMCRYSDALMDAHDPAKMAEEWDKEPEEGEDEEKAKAKFAEARALHGKLSKYMEHPGRKKFAESENVEGQSTMNLVTPESKPEKYSEQHVKTLIAQAKADIRKEMESDATSVLSILRTEKEAKKKEAFQAFCESAFKSGKIFPTEYDCQTKSGSLLDLLMAADDVNKVHKFSEGGTTTTLTTVELHKKNIQSRPSMFNERVRSGGSPLTTETGEVAKVEQHFERFSETFHKTRTSKENFVKAFKAMQAKDPTFTAEQYTTMMKTAAS